jgi:hypothetical protein
MGRKDGQLFLKILIDMTFRGDKIDNTGPNTWTGKTKKF